MYEKNKTEKLEGKNQNSRINQSNGQQIIQKKKSNLLGCLEAAVTQTD